MKNPNKNVGPDKVTILSHVGNVQHLTNGESDNSLKTNETGCSVENCGCVHSADSAAILRTQCVQPEGSQTDPLAALAAAVWTPEHDNERRAYELLQESIQIRNLERAGALIAAEIDRLKRAAAIREDRHD